MRHPWALLCSLAVAFGVTAASVQAQRFVFTVTQRGPVYGPRVFELDGFAAVPEPSTWAMAAAGFALAAIARLRRVRRGRDPATGDQRVAR